MFQCNECPEYRGVFCFSVKSILNTEVPTFHFYQCFQHSIILHLDLLLSALSLILFPLVFFFSFLYYTDVGATLFVLLGYYLAIKNHHLPAAMVIISYFIHYNLVSFQLAIIKRCPAYTVVSIDRFQLAVIERFPAYTVVSIDRFQLAVIER